MKRLGIFVLYDSQNIIDRYVLYWMEELQKVLDRMIIVYNGALYEAERNKLLKYSPEVLERENLGYDAGAYKDVVCNYLKWEEIGKYDEMVLCNDTCYGPFIPLKQVFAKMEEFQLDFWGITKHYEDGRVPEHIQSYFLVVRERLLHSDDFIGFWEEMVYPKDVDEAIRVFELAFTQQFSQKGYRYDSFVNTEKYRESDIEYNYDFLSKSCYKLVNELDCPVFKKKSLVLDRAEPYEKKRLLNYVRDNTDYDVNMIWENVLRLYNIFEINDMLYLHYVLDDFSECLFPVSKRMAIVVCLLAEENLTECLQYLTELSHVADIYIGAAEEGTYQKLIEVSRSCWNIARCNPDRLFDFLFIDLKNVISSYEYIAFINDRKFYVERNSSPIDDSLRTYRWDNLLKSTQYISKIIRLFEQNSELGILVSASALGLIPSLPYQPCWGASHPYVKAILESASVSVPISPELEYVCASAFWARRDALEHLWMLYEKVKGQYDNKPIDLDEIIGYALPYFAQSNGYITASIENALYTARLYKIMQENMKGDEQNRLLAHRLLVFCNNNKKIYIYGAGKYGKVIVSLLKRYMMHTKIEAFVISDDQPDRPELLGYPVIPLSESDYTSETTGYIIALGVKNTEEVMPILKEKGIDNIYTLY